MSEPPIDVAIVGGGPAGLSAAAQLAARGGARVCVFEREASGGGIPRHAAHPGFGVRDLHRVLSGPEYARRLTERALHAGVQLRTMSQVTGFNGAGALQVTSPAGRVSVAATAVLLATGCRERPRSARLIAGARPLGSILTTGQLQQLVYLDGVSLADRRAVVVGAEHVSFSALQTLAHAGARTVGMVTEQPRHQSLSVFARGARVRYRAPLLTGSVVSEVHGDGRVGGVTVVETRSGRSRRLDCDLLVLTADWIPDHELAVAAGARLDPSTRGPAVTPSGHTTRTGLFAAGNLLRGAETADLAALEGRAVTEAILGHLDGRPWPASVPEVVCQPPLTWLVTSAGVARVRASERLHDVRIELSQDDRVLARARRARVMPGRSTALPAGFWARVDARGGPVRVRVLRARRPDAR